MTALPSTEVSPLIASARAEFRSPSVAEMQKYSWANQKVRFIDTGRSLPNWYKEPKPITLPKGYTQAHSTKVWMDNGDVKFHIIKGEDDGYRNVTMADIVFCLSDANEPTVILKDGDDKSVEIPLGNENRKFIVGLEGLNVLINLAANETPPNNSESVRLTLKRDEFMQSNSLIAGIFKEVGSGTTLNNVMLKVAGGAIQ